MNTVLLHHYRAARAHQRATYGSKTVYPSGRTEFTGGGAWYGHHALAALNCARGQIHFRAYLADVVAIGKKRSKATKRAWKTRRAAA